MNIDLLHRLFIYDHVNGVLYWKDSERRHLAGDDVTKNQENRTDSRNKHGEKGISFNRLKKKFEVCIRINGKSHRKCGISTLSDAIKIRNGFMNSTELV